MLVEVKEVSKHLGKFKLEQVSMELPKGFIMGLIGPNGAGKTTTIKLILGLQTIDSGKVYINGYDIEGWYTTEELTGESVDIESAGIRRTGYADYSI